MTPTTNPRRRRRVGGGGTSSDRRAADVSQRRLINHDYNQPTTTRCILRAEQPFCDASEAASVYQKRQCNCPRHIFLAMLRDQSAFETLTFPSF